MALGLQSADRENTAAISPWEPLGKTWAMMGLEFVRPVFHLAEISLDQQWTVQMT